MSCLNQQACPTSVKVGQTTDMFIHLTYLLFSYRAWPPFMPAHQHTDRPFSHDRTMPSRLCLFIVSLGMELLGLAGSFIHAWQQVKLQGRWPYLVILLNHGHRDTLGLPEQGTLQSAWYCVNVHANACTHTHTHTQKVIECYMIVW